MEHLFLCAQDAALTAAQAWCATRLDAIAQPGELPMEGFAGLFAALIDDWSHDHRRLALAWCECHLLAARNPVYAPALERWQRHWVAFWSALCARFGMADHGALTSIIFDNESQLHLIRWRRIVDRACLDELCRGWASWLSGRQAQDGPWREFACEEAQRTVPRPPDIGGMAERIANAAAGAIEQHGIAGLTHRAVAAIAGVTLGVVTYNFKTSADLAKAAFEVIYRRLVSGNGNSGGDAPAFRTKITRAEAIEAMARLDMRSADFLAIDELLLAVARDEGLRPFAPQLRYLRGQASHILFEAIAGPDKTMSRLDMTLCSAFAAGQRRALIGRPADYVETQVRRNLGMLHKAVSAGA